MAAGLLDEGEEDSLIEILLICLPIYLLLYLL